MAIERVRTYLKAFQMDQQILEFETSSATVDLAAQAVGCEAARITKSLTFLKDDRCIMILTAGDMKIDNKKFKTTFEVKAKMLKPDEVLHFTNHAIGGVCPFGVNYDMCDIYLDKSLNRFETVFPACGSSNSAIEVTPKQLMETGQCRAIVDVCKGYDE